MEVPKEYVTSFMDDSQTKWATLFAVKNHPSFKDLLGIITSCEFAFCHYHSKSINNILTQNVFRLRKNYAYFEPNLN